MVTLWPEQYILEQTVFLKVAAPVVHRMHVCEGGRVVPVVHEKVDAGPALQRRHRHRHLRWIEY